MQPRRGPPSLHGGTSGWARSGLLAWLPLVALVSLLGASAPARSAAPRAFLEENADLRQVVTDYKATLPGRDSNAYLVADEAELATIESAVRLALAGDAGRAALVLDALGYDLVTLADTGSGGSYFMLRERTPCGRCWGLYVLNRSAAAHNVTIEVPHPLFDAFTPELGIEAYVRLDAQEFLMASSHRYANGADSHISDMAHNPHSLFQRLHEALTDPDSDVFQYHGFALRNHPDYPNVVLSNGSDRPHFELLQLRGAIEARGETAGVYDGQSWNELGATTNVQGQYTRRIGGRFYHLEHEFGIRADPARRSAMVEAALAALFVELPK